MNTTSKFAVLAALVITMGCSAAYAESTGQFIDDATVTTKVKAALLADSQLKTRDISVETTKGVVVLSGAVENTAQEAEAIKVVNKVKGVQSVKDNLTIMPADSK